MRIKSKSTFKGVSKTVGQTELTHKYCVVVLGTHKSIRRVVTSIRSFQSPKLYLQAEQEPASSDIFFSRDAVDWYNQLCHIWWHPYQQKTLIFQTQNAARHVFSTEDATLLMKCWDAHTPKQFVRFDRWTSLINYIFPIEFDQEAYYTVSNEFTRRNIGHPKAGHPIIIQGAICLSSLWHPYCHILLYWNGAPVCQSCLTYIAPFNHLHVFENWNGRLTYRIHFQEMKDKIGSSDDLHFVLTRRTVSYLRRLR